MISTIKLTKTAKIIVSKSDDDFHIIVEIFNDNAPLCYLQITPDQAGALMSAIDFASKETPTV